MSEKLKVEQLAPICEMGVITGARLEGVLIIEDETKDWQTGVWTECRVEVYIGGVWWFFDVRDNTATELKTGIAPKESWEVRFADIAGYNYRIRVPGNKVLPQTIYHCDACDYRHVRVDLYDECCSKRIYCHHPKVVKVEIEDKDFDGSKRFPKWCPLDDKEVE